MKKRPTNGLQRSNRLKAKCEILALTIRALKPIYLASHVTPDQIQLLETMIGAAIWYLPQPPELWTGFASPEALEALAKGTSVTRDHACSRKVAARELLNLQEAELTGENLYLLYNQKFGRFNYVTKTQNRALMRFQRISRFSSMEKCYSQAGIALVEIHRKEISATAPEARNELAQRGSAG